MNPERLIAWLQNFGGAITKALTPSQLLSLAFTFAAVVAVTVGAAYWITTPTYRVLFSDLDPESAATVVDQLRGAEVDFKLDPGGRTVRVPSTELDELRLQFARDGMPSSGRIGFEIFDRTAFGATEFLEQVNFRRALEGEIARTIATLAEVSGARVHISMARTAVFGRTESPAKASVVLKLHGSKRLSPQAVNGIANLVSAGVEGLQPEAVVVVDSYGRSLNVTDPPEDPSGFNAERRLQLESDLTSRVVALLEPVVGVGRVRANVAVRLQSETEEATEELWDPTAQVVRSRHVSGDGDFLNSSARGTAGARANLPPAVVPASAVAETSPEGEEPAADDSGADADDPAVTEPVDLASPPAAIASPGGASTPRGSETTNYEISKSVRHVVRPAGDIERLSVAVILDNQVVNEPSEDGEGEPVTRVEARSAEDLEKIRGLVAAAVGLDPTRGDQLTVENVPFEEVPETELADPPFWQRYMPQMLEGARILGALLAVLALLWFGLRPLVSRVTAALPSTGQRSGAGGLPGGEAGQLGGSDAAGQLNALTAHASTLSAQEPENAARLVRAWLGEEKR